MIKKYLWENITSFLKNDFIWKESLLAITVLFFPLLCSFAFSIDAFINLSKDTFKFIIVNVTIIYLLTVIVNGIIPFKKSKLFVLAAGITPFVWILSNSIIFMVLQNNVTILTYICAVYFFLFCYTVNYLLFVNLRTNNLLLQLTKYVYSFSLFFLTIPAIVNLGYVVLYGIGIDDFVLLSILQTNLAEAKSYLLTIFSPEKLFFIGLLFFFLLIGIVLSVSRFTISNDVSTFFKGKNWSFFCIILLAILLLTGSFLYKYHFYIFPFANYYSINNADNGLLRVFVDFNKNIKGNASQIRISDLNNTAQTGTIILVIGESANRDYMSAFNPNILENTTPWEKQMRETSDFVFFDNAYSNYPLTVLALSLALTNSNQYNNISFNKAVSIIDIAKKAGFMTHFYSMQQKGTLYDAGVALIAKQADQVEFVCEEYWGYDEKILQSLKNISPLNKNFVILHLRGSHFKYSERYPATFAQANGNLFSNPHNEYKLSLLYTDYILKRIFQYAKDNLNLQSMIYFSDHGEDMKYTHLPNYFTFSMVHIPLWIYLSPTNFEKQSDFLINLKRNRQAIFTNDLMFDTLHGLLQCKSNFYDERFDLSGKNYNLSLKEAKTMYGEKNIKDDLIRNAY